MRHIALFATFALAVAAAGQAPAEGVNTPLGPGTFLFEPQARGNIRWTLWVNYRDDRGAFRDHEQYLADLQRRYGARGVRIAVAMPEAPAKRVAAAAPAFALAAIRPEVDLNVLPPVFSALADGTDPMFGTAGIDGAVDCLDAAVGGKIEQQRVAELVELVPSLLDGIMDGGDFAERVDFCATAWPHSGRARALQVLQEWWCRGDPEAARRLALDGAKALADETVPLVEFADLVLRGDRLDVAIAQRLAEVLAPVAAAVPAGPTTQLTYLRALLRAGEDRSAGRLVARLHKQFDGQPAVQLLFAETLMEAREPAVYRDLADRALAAAQKGIGSDEQPGSVDRRLHFAARHKVLFRCGDLEAAEKLMAEYRQSPVFSNSLNNDAWYLMTQPDSMGRFDPFALAQCEEMLRVEGAAIDSGNKDTVALSMFVNGRFDRAVELQAEASKAAGNNPRYVGRLVRFENAQKAQLERDKGSSVKAGGDGK